MSDNQEPAPDVAQRSFTDNDGRSWLIAINVGQVRRVKSTLGIDLFGAADGDMLKEVAADPMGFCDLLWCLIEPAATAASVDQETFWLSVDDGVLDQATMAFLEALVAFFRPEQQKPLRVVLAKMQAAEAKKNAATMELVNSPQMDEFIDHKMTQALERAKAALTPGGGSSGTAPAT